MANLEKIIEQVKEIEQDCSELHIRTGKIPQAMEEKRQALYKLLNWERDVRRYNASNLKREKESGQSV